jgi:hypothetical protein
MINRESSSGKAAVLEGGKEYGMGIMARVVQRILTVATGGHGKHWW